MWTLFYNGQSGKAAIPFCVGERNLRLRSLAALLGFIVLGACAGTLGQAVQSGDQNTTVRGIVINAATHEPVGRALVSSSGNQMAMLTDAEGHFEFALPKPSSDSTGATPGPGQARPRQSRPGGPLWLTARKPGFLDRPNEAGQVQGIPGSEVTISLVPESLIKGRVILATGDPASGISVQLFVRQAQEGALHWVQGAQTRANSNGEFRFAELSPGVYKVVTREMMDDDPADTVIGGQQYGFPPVYYPGVPDFASAGTIQLTAGQNYQADLSIVRQPYYPVRIPVANAEANGGVRVTVSVKGHRGPEYSLGYGGGKQRIEGFLPNGNYLVEASTFGLDAESGAVNVVVAGAPAEGPSLVLTRNSSVHLQVTEEFTDTSWQGRGTWSDGTHNFELHGPRAYLQVRIEAAEDFAIQRNASLRPPRSPNDDALVSEDLVPGRYWLRITSSHGYVASATMGGVDVLRQPFSVVSGPSTPIEITMRDDTAQIDGSVTDVATAALSPSGPAPPQAYVYCVPLADSSGQYQPLGVSADGTFHSQAMTPGTYRIMAFKTAQPNLPYRDAEAMRAYDSAGQVVRLGGGEKVNVQLPISANVE